MTAETEISVVCKGEIVEACDLDMSSYEDLPKGGGECNGDSHEALEGVVGNVKGDSDGSYVFVCSCDAVSIDCNEKDLNEDSPRKPDHPEDDKEVQVGDLNIQNGENDQMSDCVHETVVSSSGNRYVDVESTGRLSMEGPEPTADVDVESELQQPNGVVNEQSSLGSITEEQSSLESCTKEQTSYESNTDDQTHPKSCAEGQTSLEPSAEERNTSESCTEEQIGLESNTDQKTNSLSSTEGQTVLESDVEQQQTGLESDEEQKTGLEFDAGQQTGFESYLEDQTGLESDAENGLKSDAEQRTGLESIIELPTRPEKKINLVSVSEHTNLESTMIAGEKPESDIVVFPEAVQCVLMQSNSGNPEVDGDINFEPSEKIAGCQEFLVPGFETTEYKFPHSEDSEEQDVGQNNIESIAEGFEVVGTNSDESDLHLHNNLHNNEQEKVQDEIHSIPISVADKNQGSEVSEGLPFDKDHEKQTLELKNDLPSEVPPEDLEVNLEQNLPTDETNMQKESDVAVGSIPHKNGEGLLVESSSLEIEVAHEWADGNQTTPETHIPSQTDQRSSFNCARVRSESTDEYVPVENAEHLPTGLDNSRVIEPEENEALIISEEFPTCAADGARQEANIANSNPISGANVLSSPDDDTKSESEAEIGPDEDDTKVASSGKDVRSETTISFGSIKFPYGDESIEPHASIANPKLSSCEPVDVGDQELMAFDLRGSIENGSKLLVSAIAEVKSESEDENLSALNNKDVISETNVLNGSVVNGKSVINSVAEAVDVKIEEDQIQTKDIDVENEGDQLTSIDSDDKLTSQEAGSILVSGTSSSVEVSCADALDSQNVSTEVGKWPFYFLIRVPRYDDEKLREEIKLAQLQVDKKTKSRDAIRSEIQMKRVVCKEYGENVEAALSEERAARDLLKSKFQEMDSVQSVINRVKNAMSVKDIDGRMAYEQIRHMEHAIEHETLPLKEEKQLIRDIKQLRNVRDQLSSNMGTQEELQQALDQKSKVEEQLRILREEVDSLKHEVQKAEVITKAAKKKYYDEIEKLNELQAQFKAADDIRQEAYTHLQSLRKKLSEKNKYFWMYKDNLKAANDYASVGNKEALKQLCVNEVETIMELWNNNDEFRREYIRCNTRSTLRRLRTLDGRSLGPDEEPPVLPNSLDERIGRSLFDPVKGISKPIDSNVEQEKQMAPAEAERADDKSMVKVANQKNQTVTSKNPTKPATIAVSATISGRGKIEENEEEEKEEHKKTEEEEGLAKKAGELRKEEEAAKLKEQLRLEEKAKAKEALERKKRNAEKAQVRADLRAQKEAEQRQREKEKKARKKERKRSSPGEATDGCKEAEPMQSAETPTETTLDSEIIIEKSRSIRKMAHKPSQFGKQAKPKPIPPPLRNRGKRRIQSWMWVVLIALLLVALFMLGNSGFSSRLGLGLRNLGF